MTSGEYLKQLEKYLRKLPQSDYEDAMEYFTEYFADAGPENEQAVIKELGTPKQAAAELMRNLLDKKVDEREAMEKEEKQKRKTAGASIVWMILALFWRSGPVADRHSPSLRLRPSVAQRYERLSGAVVAWP